MKYIAFTWNSSDFNAYEYVRILDDRLKNVGLKKVYSVSGLMVFSQCAENEIIPIELNSYAEALKGGGVLFGHLFKNFGDTGSGDSVETIDGQAAEDVLLSEGRYIVKKYWGNYVAFLNSNNCSYILRDPTGSIRCYRYQYCSINFYFSDLRLLINALPNLKFDINESFIRTSLTFRIVDGERTALAGVEKVLPGQCIKVKEADYQKLTYWHPQYFISPPADCNITKLQKEIRDNVIRTITTLLSTSDKIVHKLSGGFDSNTVLSAIKSGDPSKDVYCINLNFGSLAADEAWLARQTASRFSTSVIFPILDPKNIFLDKYSIFPKSPEPIFHLADIALREPIAAEYARVGASALTSGDGGDEIFGRLPRSCTAIDYVRNKGIDFGLFRVSYDAARLGGVSFYRALGDAIRFGLYSKRMKLNELLPPNRKSLYGWDADDPDIYEQFLHPWIMDLAEIPPAKWNHVLGLSVPACRYSPSAEFWGMKELTPLLSQPIMETVLSIPAYTLQYQGRDRGLARMAFANILPDEVVWRESKGSGSDFFEQVGWNNREFLKEFLLDGELVKKGFAIRSELERLLVAGTIDQRQSVSECVDLASYEAWMRSVL